MSRVEFMSKDTSSTTKNTILTHRATAENDANLACFYGFCGSQAKIILGSQASIRLKIRRVMKDCTVCAPSRQKK